MRAEVSDHNAIVAAVSDEETAARRVSQHLARKQQGRARVASAFQRQFQRCAINNLRAQPVIVGDHSAEIVVKRLEGDFARLPDNAAAERVDDGDGGPSAHAPAIPNLELIVVEHGVVDFVSLHDLAQILGLAFSVKFCRVHADDHHLFGEFLLDLFQDRNDVQAIDAAVCPEVKDNDLAHQPVHRERIIDVYPVQIGREFRRGDLTFVQLLRRALRLHQAAQRQQRQQQQRQFSQHAFSPKPIRKRASD